jgi:hypothetical protein
MKYIIILFLLFSKAEAQLNSGIGIGYDTRGNAIAQLSAGYEIGIVQFNAEIRPSLTRNSLAHNYIGGGLSFNLLNHTQEIHYLFAGAAYYYDDRSHDTKTLNSSHVGYSLKYVWMMNYQGAIYFQPMFINKSFQTTCGMILKFD